MITDYLKLNLQTCDIGICSGDGNLSNSIKSFQRFVGFRPPASDLSHVVGAVRLNYQQLLTLRHLMAGMKGGEWIDSDPNDLYIFESTTHNKWCNKKGVQVNPMSEWLKNYNGKVYVRKLTTDDKTAETIKFIIEHIDDKYENGIAGFFELLFCGLMLSRFIRKIFPKWKPADTKTPHCSELIAKWLKHLGLLKDIAIENRMPPAVWADRLQIKKLHLETACLNENILCSMTELIRIK